MAVGGLALAREPFDLATLGGRFTSVRPVHELVADQARHLAPSPEWLVTLRIARRVGGAVIPVTAASCRRYPRIARTSGASSGGVEGEVL